MDDVEPTSNTARAFTLKLLEGFEKQDVASVLGHARAARYQKMLERSHLPARSLEFLPAVNASSTCVLGRQSGRLFREIARNYVSKPSKNLGSDDSTSNSSSEESEEADSDVDDDNSALDSSSAESGDPDDESGGSSNGDLSEDPSINLESSDDESDEESAEGTSTEDSASEVGALESMVTQTDFPFNKLEHILEEEVSKAEESSRLPREQVSLMFCRDKARFKPVDFDAVEGIPRELRGQQFETPPKPIPGFAQTGHPRLKSRGGEPFFNYCGRWENGKLAGDGHYFFAGGTRYRGQWADDLPHGIGQAEYPDGARYEGKWERGQKHGFGVSISPDGARFEGSYEHGERCGEGTLVLPSGTVYTGNFVSGRFHGRGEMRSPQGWSYTGFWVRGMICGSGKLTSPEGKELNRAWRPARSFRDVVRSIVREQEEASIREIQAKRRLRQALDDSNLRQHVQRLRQKRKEQILADIMAEKEELSALRRQLREERLKAKQALLFGDGADGDEDQDEPDWGDPQTVAAADADTAMGWENQAGQAQQPDEMRPET